MIQKSALPASLMDLAGGGLEGQGGLRPDRCRLPLPLVAAVSTLKGQAATVAWLKGLKASGQVFDNDEVFVSVVTELTATLLSAPTGTTTLATQVWADTTTLAFAAAAPYAALMTRLSLLASWLLVGHFRVTTAVG